MSQNGLQKILYVEDEPDISQIAKLALESIGGFTVEACENGFEALRKAPGFCPQLILLDVMMPEMDGPATMLKLRALPGLEKTPVVFMTAKVQPSEVESYKQLGAVDVIAKPFDPMGLADNIRAIWQRCQA
ncbi:MAG: response regulator [Gammaproteobacteria bacterium]|nr:response regulator [Gammaproteobacteria bacterium]